jgi:hypothetical protein
MRKLTVLLAMALVFALVAPALASDVNFSGAYRVRGFWEEGYDLARGSGNSQDHPDAFLDMRLRVQTDIKVNDNLSLTTRFDALDGKLWGNTDLPAAPSGNNIDWDRAFMTIKTDFGLFQIGRKTGGTFGLTVFDSEGERDRIQYALPLGNFTLIALYEKLAEGDAGNLLSDTDVDGYAIAGVYKGENFLVGVLYEFVNNSAGSDLATVQTETEQHVFIPYFTFNMGNFRAQGEFDYIGGTTRFHNAQEMYHAGFYNTLADAIAGGSSLEFDTYALNLEVGYDFGMGSVTAGYVHMSGDDDGLDGTRDGFDGTGDDWEYLWILTGSTGNSCAGLGAGYAGSYAGGNLSDTGQGVAGAANRYGANLFYAGVSGNVMENLTLGAKVGTGWADKVPRRWDDGFGWETDFTLDYTMFDNLTYSAVAAYLWAGEFYGGAQGANTGGNDTEPGDAWSLFHSLTLSF